jgi:PKD repeat protein
VVTVTIGALTTTVQVVGASPPSTGTPTPPTPGPTPPSITPIAIINAPSTATIGVSVLFGVSAPAQGQTWTWNFGDGGTAQTTAFTIAHTYGTAGTYTVTASAPGITSGNASITVSNPAGSAASTLSATVACTPAAHGTATPCNIASVNYGSTTIPSASVTAVSWDWGDGSAVTNGITSSRTYVAAGTYNIVTTVTANTVDGSKSVTVVKSITIS